MSRNICGRIRGCDFWCLDNSIQIGLATLVEHLRSSCHSPELAAQLESWAIHVGVNDLHFEVPTDWEESTYLELDQALSASISTVIANGDYEQKQVQKWYILDDLLVTGGHLRLKPYPARAVIDFLEAFSKMLTKEYPVPPEGEAAYIGYPGE